ncbi:MAG: prephenate dehydrogenase/arogenate dehydrogenase family protein [Deltaproteobacteria bacterium]|nr:prephenate dehydrogenase/arogenate dehydrogenase family protein [Deltaproteobacteria bacterium]
MFETVSIIGIGLIGGSLAAAFRRRSISKRIIGISSLDTIAKAKELKLIDQGYGYDSLAQGVRNANLVILCTPIARIIELVPMVAEHVSPGTIISDVGSTKRAIMTIADENLPEQATFIGGHPMAGSEKRGVSASDPFLFENAIYILTPSQRTLQNEIDSLRDAFSAIGAQVVILDPELHDRIAATISHLPQMLAVGLVNMLGSITDGRSEYVRLAAGGFRDMTRIASSPFTVWRDICATNRDLIREKLDEYISQLREIRELVGTEALGEKYAQASLIRNAIPKDTKGFLYPRPEVLVVTADKPGMLARITTALADKEINISDIEVLKVREGEGGTIRLALMDNETAKQAAEILREQGFEARMRG